MTRNQKPPNAAVEVEVPPPAPVLSVKDKIKGAKRPTRTVDICLHTDLQGEFEAADQQLREAVAREATDQRLNSGSASKALAQQVENIRARMQDHVITFEMRSLSKRRWSDLLDEHPPRDGNTLDARSGHNVDTFYDAAIRECTVAPDLDDEDWRTLFGDSAEEEARRKAAGESVEEGKLTPRQFRELQDAVLELNVNPVSVPNSYAASRILRAHESE